MEYQEHQVLWEAAVVGILFGYRGTLEHQHAPRGTVF